MFQQAFLYRLLCIFCVLLILSVKADANADNIDSLVKLTTDGTAEQRLAAYKSLAAYYVTRNFEMSISYGEQGMTKALESGDSVLVGELQNIKGEAQYLSGNYDSAAECFFAALRIFEKKQERRLQALAHNNLAKLYRKVRELDKADMYYNKSMELFEELDDTAGMEMIWNEWGVVYEYRGNYEKAVQMYSKALELAELTDNKLGIGYALNNISGSYLLQGRYNVAKEKLLRALSIRKELKDSFALAINYSDLGALYDTMKQDALANAYFDSSNAIASVLKYPQLLAHNYELMSGMAKKHGRFEQAYLYYLKADGIHDSLYQVERMGQVEELNTKYQTGQKEQQILRQQLEISRRNYLVAGISLLFIMGILLGYSNYRRYKLRQEKRLQQEVIHQQHIATQAVLEAEENERQRIGQDLHDGVGQMMSAVKINLTTLYNQVPFADSADNLKYQGIIDLVDESCMELRAISHNMMPNALLKSGLAFAVRDFINKIDERVLEVNMYTDGLNERLDTDTETILYRVVQECVNNVIKHAAATRLDISIIREPDGISLTIEDNGKGFDTRKADTQEGIGLKNIRARIAYLKGTIDIDSKPGKGTAIIINVRDKG